MSEISTGLFPVSAPPERPKSGGGAVGRPSPFAEVLAQLRDKPNEWFRITAEPLDAAGKETKSGSAARRIASGSMKGVQGGEYETSYSDGHVFAKFVGSAGVEAYAAGEPAREAARQARAAKRAEKAGQSAAAAPAEQPGTEPASVTAEPAQPELVSVGADANAASGFTGDQW